MYHLAVLLMDSLLTGNNGTKMLNEMGQWSGCIQHLFCYFEVKTIQNKCAFTFTHLDIWQCVYLSSFFIIYCVIDALASVYTWKTIMCMCLYWGRGSPVKIFASRPIPVMIMCFMLSCDKMNKQASNKQALGGQKRIRLRQMWTEWQWPPVVKVLIICFTAWWSKGRTELFSNRAFVCLCVWW